MNTIHISENNIISYIICTEIIDYETAYPLQCIHYIQWLHSMCEDDLLMLSFAIFCNN